VERLRTATLNEAASSELPMNAPPLAIRDPHEHQLHPPSSSVRVLHTVASLKRSQGGPSVSVSRLCTALGAHGAQVGLLSQNDASSLDDCILPASRRVQTRLVRQIPAMGQRLAWSPFFHGALVEECRRQKIQVIHDHGLWLPSNHAAARCARTLGLPFVVHPRGMLEPWALSYRAWKKRIAWKLYQQKDLASASLLFAASSKVAESIRAAGLRQPIAILPNGVDMPRWEPPVSRQDIQTALFLSRVHPKRGFSIS
jgi:glycosyltransferase involved in cell wall biosynthesis